MGISAHHHMGDPVPDTVHWDETPPVPDDTETDVTSLNLRPQRPGKVEGRG